MMRRTVIDERSATRLEGFADRTPADQKPVRHLLDETGIHPDDQGFLTLDQGVFIESRTPGSAIKSSSDLLISCSMLNSILSRRGELSNERLE